MIGAVLSLALRRNVARVWASLVSQTLATGLVLARTVPLLLSGGDERRVFAWPYPIETLTAHLDALGAFFLTWSLPMTLLGSVYAAGYLRRSFTVRNAGVQFALLNLTSLSFVMIYTLETATAFLLGWELAAVAAWLLVIWEYRNQKIRFAGFNYLVSTHIGFFVLVAAFMLMYSATGSMEFESFGRFLRAPGPVRNLTFILLVVSFGLKSAFFPFHSWLPRAHSAAPAHVSALMSGVIHKAGLFALLRFTLLLGTPEEWMGWFILSVSALSALVGVLYTSSQRDLKRLLGYSSTENVGIAGIGFGVGYLGLSWGIPSLAAAGFIGGILHVLNHALFKCLLFYAAGAVYQATHTVDIERLGGLIRRMPRTAGCFLVGAVAISALPPLNGFVSELFVYSGLFDSATPTPFTRVTFIGIAALLAFVGGVSALSMSRAFGVSFLGSPRDPSVHCDGETGRFMQLPMALHVLGILAIGLYPPLGLALVRAPAALLISSGGGSVPADPGALLNPLVMITAVFALVLVTLLIARRWLLGGSPETTHVTWGCGYTAPNTRMQYTGTSYSSQFVSLFTAVLPQLRRKKLPEVVFPKHSSYVNTHSVDVVERRLYEGLGSAERWIVDFAKRIPDEPRVSFAAGLIGVAFVVWLALGGTP